MDYLDWAYGIVPLEYPGQTYPGPPRPGQAVEPPLRVPTVYTFDNPWWALGSQAIEAARQAAIVHEGGHPPQPQPVPYPVPYPSPGAAQPPSGAGIQLSTNTLMILGLIGFAFVIGGKRGR